MDDYDNALAIRDLDERVRELETALAYQWQVADAERRRANALEDRSRLPGE
jgi:hypothetical protein